jgi:hypothetical protein
MSLFPSVTCPVPRAPVFPLALLLILNTARATWFCKYIPESKHDLSRAPSTDDKLASNGRLQEDDEDGEYVKFVFLFLLLPFTFTSLSHTERKFCSPTSRPLSVEQPAEAHLKNS